MNTGNAIILSTVIALAGCSSGNNRDRSDIPIPQDIAQGDASKVLGFVFSQMETIVKVNSTTELMEHRAASALSKLNARGYFKGYYKYPNYVCASVNEQVTHTPPTRRRLKNGDLLKLEFGVEKDGQYAVLAWTYPIGPISERQKALMDCGKAALDAGVNSIRPGVSVASVTKTMDGVIRNAGFVPNSQYVGYGIGTAPVMLPQIPCAFDPQQPPEGRFTEDQTVSLLVIVHDGEPSLRVGQDGWTVFSQDQHDSVAFSTMVRLHNGVASRLIGDRRVME